MNSFEYYLLFSVKHIQRVDGLSGCYRGLTPKLVGSIVGAIGSAKIANKLGIAKEENRENEEIDGTEVDETKSTEEER